jgi:hypothetical protein
VSVVLAELVPAKINNINRAGSSAACHVGEQQVAATTTGEERRPADCGGPRSTSQQTGARKHSRTAAPIN